ncbi:velvet factor-domain-containing protein [Lenzites betulinus]|nr:velvet factor-domain-containing protein [Lenzites betulinus]
MQRAGSSDSPPLGQPTSFTSGPFDGLTVRVELKEIQKADIGRKYASKDKRPLDPPPVVQCHFYRMQNQSPAHQTEEELNAETAISGAVCHVDLFSVPDDFAKYMIPPHPTIPVPPASTSQAPPYPSPFNPTLSCPHPPSVIHNPASLWQSQQEQFPTGQSLPTLPPLSQLPIGHAHQDYAIPARPTMSYEDAQSSSGTDSDIVAWLGSFPIRKASKCTHLLAGVTFTQAQCVDYNGKRAAMFVYSDLAVRAEGTFILRYRALHISSQVTPEMPFRILAECYGGPFKIYSTKAFPGLPPSTALTRLLSMHNVRVNIRETERKRRRTSKAQDDHGEEISFSPHRESDGDSRSAQGSMSQPHSPVERTRTSPILSASHFSASGSSTRLPQTRHDWSRSSGTHDPNQWGKQ